MPLTTPVTGTSDHALGTDRLGIDAVSERVKAATAQLAAIEQERAHYEREWREARATIAQAGQRTIDRMEKDRPLPEARGAAEAVFATLQADRERWATRVAQVCARMRKQLRATLEQRLMEIERSHAAVPEPSPPTPEMARETERRRTAFQAELERLRKQVATLGTDIGRACRRAGVHMDPAAVATDVLPTWDLPRLMGLVREEIEDAQTQFVEVSESSAYGAVRPGGLLFIHSMVALPHIALLAALYYLASFPDVVPWAIASSVATQALIVLSTWLRRRFLAKRFAQIHAAHARVGARVELLDQAVTDALNPRLTLHQRLANIPVDDRADRAKTLQSSTDAALTAVRKRERALAERIAARFDLTLEAVTIRAAERAQLEQERHRAAIERETAALAERLSVCDRGWGDVRSRLEQRWTEAVAAVRAYAAAVGQRAATLQPAWSHPSWSSWSPPGDYAGEILLGRARMSLADFAATCDGPGFPVAADVSLEIPVALGLPSPSSLLVRAGAGCRHEALRLANQIVLRSLASFPPGRLRLTLIDPVGLGDSFAGLLDMADHDEALLGGGILNDATRIERGLEDLIAHLEMVIQKHLRGRYATIDDYNREAGEMQEALRLVVVADFPASFSERAIEHLSVLIRSGARCGVHVVVLHDDRKPLPGPLDLAWFRQSGLILREVQGRLAIDRDPLHAWTFVPEPPPSTELATRLIGEIGKLALGAKRIEVPFTSVAPSPDAVWSLSAASHLSIPIGKRGADRLQHFELGRGTCQHALIGGRTGSGKSTLFHVLVTSAALWYSPRELEFHLIDFKKGVEFKAFAAHHLPHARVIAIESDREFGLSVLRHLDQELTRRGDSFRRAGAQDLAAHRKAGGEYLPRILLLIDEFQEFFTEDDAIARDAALLLDRFVRQGRAFGVHVVLGSQTLGGSYALAKSSLGQMGVRIALPCNENDAHLLLHEDNDAARLLTRPGDGIYNDRAGLVEGNSPFQVCWLSEELEAAQLDHVAGRAQAEGWKPQRPPVIFEGNGPSNLEEELDLAALLARPHVAEDARMRAAIGQSSSLKGAAEATFPASAGGNVLIVGQNREAAAATCGAIAIGLAARHAPGKLRLMALDGEDQDGPFARLHERLAAVLPHGSVRHEARSLAAALGELSSLLERRQSGADADHAPVLVTVFALQRLRQLRPDDDLGGRDGGEP
ncbi:MAG: hypothetical protein H0V44_16715, partial [Planctomycetes bacterium]|nr:hypothetical protein [Planctomycetota bacterium]